LDDIADPRVTELESDDEEAPQLVKEKPTKSKNKRAAEDDVDEAPDGILKKASDGQQDKRQAKKLKNNAGQAVSGAEINGNAKHTKDSKAEEPKESKKSKADGKKEDSTPQSNGKKVQFAEKLEQGPTPSKNAPTQSKGPRNVNGITVDDKKTGTGPAAKKGDRVGMRYIGKLKDGKVFDCKHYVSPVMSTN
jgi:FK506-binding nuclear protein